MRMCTCIQMEPKNVHLSLFKTLFLARKTWCSKKLLSPSKKFETWFLIFLSVHENDIKRFMSSTDLRESDVTYNLWCRQVQHPLKQFKMNKLSSIDYIYNVQNWELWTFVGKFALKNLYQLQTNTIYQQVYSLWLKKKRTVQKRCF